MDAEAPYAPKAIETGVDFTARLNRAPVKRKPEPPAAVRTPGSPAASVVPCSPSGCVAAAASSTAGPVDRYRVLLSVVRAPPPRRASYARYEPLQDLPGCRPWPANLLESSPHAFASETTPARPLRKFQCARRSRAVLRCGAAYARVSLAEPAVPGARYAFCCGPRRASRFWRDHAHRRTAHLLPGFMHLLSRFLYLSFGFLLGVVRRAAGRTLLFRFIRIAHQVYDFSSSR